jgi:hypothetical protein
MGRACSTNGEKRNTYRILVGKAKGKRPLGRPICRWADNIKTDLREIGWDGMDWIDLAQDRDQWRGHVNTVMNLRVPIYAGKFMSGCTIAGSQEGLSSVSKLGWDGAVLKILRAGEPYGKNIQEHFK